MNLQILFSAKERLKLLPIGELQKRTLIYKINLTKTKKLFPPSNQAPIFNEKIKVNKVKICIVKTYIIYLKYLQ